MGALACALVAVVLSGSGAGLKDMETTLQDDALFLHRPPAQVYGTAKQVAALGADRVRLTAGWSVIAPRPKAKRMPGAPFDGSDPSTYPDGAWRSLDTAVKAVDAAGLKTQIDLGFWAPRWAVGRPAKNRLRQRIFPSAEEFGAFAEAVAKRYSGGHKDPADPKKKLPAVRMWTTWNEPNHPSFLQPQWIRDDDGGYRPESPHVYRAMHNAAYDAIKSVSRQNLVLMGGTSSFGSQVPGKGGVPPLEFLRAMACVDDQLKPLRVPECRNFTPLRADGWAHHPYSRTVTPATSDPFADDVPIADTPRLATLLDTLHKMHRIAGRLQIFDTEYGYESSQDDPFVPFSRDQQAAFVGWSTYLAWKDPDTAMFAQFLLRDIDPAESGHRRGTRRYYRDWQTGLYAADGSAKPAAQAFKLPFWAQTEGSADKRVVLLFGGVRPGHGLRTVRVERQLGGTGPWVPIRTFGPACTSQDPEFLTDPTGFFLRTAPFEQGAAYRFAWRHNDDGHWEVSIPISVADDGSLPPPIA